MGYYMRGLSTNHDRTSDSNFFSLLFIQVWTQSYDASVLTAFTKLLCWKFSLYDRIIIRCFSHSKLNWTHSCNRLLLEHSGMSNDSRRPAPIDEFKCIIGSNTTPYLALIHYSSYIAYILVKIIATLFRRRHLFRKRSDSKKNIRPWNDFE